MFMFEKLDFFFNAPCFIRLLFKIQKRLHPSIHSQYQLLPELKAKFRKIGLLFEVKRHQRCTKLLYCDRLTQPAESPHQPDACYCISFIHAARRPP